MMWTHLICFLASCQSPPENAPKQDPATPVPVIRVEVPAEVGPYGSSGAVSAAEDKFWGLADAKLSLERRKLWGGEESVSIKDICKTLGTPAENFGQLCTKVVLVRHIIPRLKVHATEGEFHAQRLLVRIAQSEQHQWVRTAALAALYKLSIDIFHGPTFEKLELFVDAREDYEPSVDLKGISKEEEIDLIRYLMVSPKGRAQRPVLAELVRGNRLRKYEALRKTAALVFSESSAPYCYSGAKYLAMFKDATSEETLCSLLLGVDVDEKRKLYLGLAALKENGIVGKRSLVTLEELSRRIERDDDPLSADQSKKILELIEEIRGSK